MSESVLAKKLRIQDAQRALIVNAPPGFLELLGEVRAAIALQPAPGVEFDYALLFVKDRAELDILVDNVLQAIQYDAVLWISYPKGGSGVKTDLNRDKLWEALSAKGIRPVSMVSIDGIWSAMRFRPPEVVGR